MPHCANRMRRRQEASRRNHDREPATDPCPTRGDRPRPFHRLGCVATRKQTSAPACGGDPGHGPQGHADRFSGAGMTDEKRFGGAPPTPAAIENAGEGAGAPPVHDEEIDESAYKVTLPSFHGPLDLLLHLIKLQEIDIYDIPIVKITEQYTAYLDAMEELNLEVAADYIYMAALLIHIKSKMLLPRDENEQPVEDPRQELVDRLLEYQRFKAVAESFA